MLGRYLRNIMPARQACLYLQGTTHLELAHRPTTKANGLSLAPGFTVQVQEDNHDTTPRPCLHSCRQKNKALFLFRMRATYDNRPGLVACSGRPHHRPPESPIYVQHISLTCLQHATPPLIFRSGLHRLWNTCQTPALQTNRRVVRRRTEYS